MRIPIDAGVEDALPPPAYTDYEADQAVTPDYAPSEVAETHDLPIRTGLRGGYTRYSSSQDAHDPNVSPNAAYFEQRRFLYDHAGPELELLEHSIHFDAGFTPTRLPFPRPSDAYLSRDVTGQDWAVFVNCLFPIDQENRKEHKKARSDEKRISDHHQDSPERREKIQAVIAEWNSGFFATRLIHISAHFEALVQHQSSRSLAPQTAPNRSPNTFEPSSYQDVNHGHAGSSFATPSSSIGGPSPETRESPRRLRRSMSKSSISSTSSSSSASSVDSISSKDLNHATLDEIRRLIDAFRTDPHKKNHLHKSVRELRHQLRTQHLPMSTSDPYNPKALKADKKLFKDARKTLRKEIQTCIKEAKQERKADRAIRKTLRKTRREARKHERREIKQCRRDEKHARRDEKRSSKDLKRSLKHQPQRPPLDPNPPLPTPSWTTDPVAVARVRSTEAIEAARTRSAEAVSAARARADAAREAARGRADAVRVSARMAGGRVQSGAQEAGRRVENRAVGVGGRVEDWGRGVGRRVEGVGERMERAFEGRRGSVARADGAGFSVAPGFGGFAGGLGGGAEPAELRAQTTGLGDQKNGVVGED